MLKPNGDKNWRAFFTIYLVLTTFISISSFIVLGIVKMLIFAEIVNKFSTATVPRLCIIPPKSLTIKSFSLIK